MPKKLKKHFHLEGKSKDKMRKKMAKSSLKQMWANKYADNIKFWETEHKD